MRRAAALPMMMFVLAMVSGLAVSGAYLTRQLSSSAATAQRAAALEPIAETGVIEAIVAWDTLARRDQAIGIPVLIFTSTADPRCDVWVTRVSTTTYWIVAEARQSARPRLARRVGAVVRVGNGRAALVSGRAWSELP